MDDFTDLTTLTGGKSPTRPTKSKKNGVALLGEVMDRYLAPIQTRTRLPRPVGNGRVSDRCWASW